MGLVVVLCAGPGRADWSDPAGPLLLPGLNLGSAVGEEPASVLLGAEISVAKGTEGLSWFGGYSDVVWLPQRDRARLSLGAEFGFLMFGVDGGPLMEIDDQGVRSDVQVRPLLSLYIVHFAARFGRTFGEYGNDFRELSLLVKYPIDLNEL